MLTTAGREAEAMAWTKSRTKSERFQATLAGLLELEVLRAKHKQMVDMALGRSNGRVKLSQDTQLGSYQYWLDGSSSRLRLTRSLSEEAFDDLERCERAQSWSRHSAEDLLLDSVGHSDEGPGPRAQPAAAWDDSSSRASSGFCEDDMSEMCSEDTDVSFLSNSFAPLFSQNAPEVSGTLRPIRMRRAEQQREVRDNGAADSNQEVIPQDSFFSVASLYPDSRWPDVSEILQPQVVLESRYRSDLRSHQGPEVYRYPSPLHAVALQSPLYAPRLPIHLNRSLGRSTMKPGLRPASVYLCSHFDFVGINSESSCLPTSMSVLPPGQACQMLPRVPCEKHRLEILIARLAKCNQQLKKQSPWSRPQRGNPASSLHRTCSMGKGRISDSKHKALKRGERTNTMSDCASVSSTRTLQNMKRAMCTNQSAGVARGDSDTALLSNAPDEDCVGVSGSKKLREAHDVANLEEQSALGIGIFSPGCIRRISSLVSDLPAELASLKV